jgi:TATA-binding protein-associated factor
MQIKVKANLRDYQRQGVTWMASLGQYNLNCALCDDMGLGKTLQALCVVLNESYIRNKKLPKGAPKALNLIVCPTSITYNWRAEIMKYFDGIRVAIYEGSSTEKTKIL